MTFIALLLFRERNIVTFIDDFSRYYQLYLLHAKYETLDQFRVFKNEYNLCCENFIKRLRSDMDGEYYDPSYFNKLVQFLQSQHYTHYDIMVWWKGKIEL